MSNCETVAVSVEVEDISVEVVCVEPHIEVQVTMSPTWADVAGKPAAFPPQAHSHAIGDVTGLQAALDGKASTTDARLSDAREWSAATVTQSEAEAGTSTSRLAFSPLRVFQAVAAWWAASTAKTKLDGIATGATANATDAQLRDRATHTGTQAHTTITGLGGAATLNVGTTAGTVAAGDDARLSNQRTPTDGSVTTAKLADGAVTAAKIASNQTVTFGTVSAGALAAGAGGVTATTGRLAVLGIGATTLFEVSSLGVVTVGTWQGTAVGVEFGGTGATTAGAARTNLGVAYGTTAGTVAAGNDARLTDQRTPTDGSVTDAKIASAGLSTSSLNWAAIQPWAANTAYAKGDLVSFAGIAYRRSAAGTSGATFNTANWQQITPSAFVASQIASGTLDNARLAARVRSAVNVFNATTYR